MVHYTVNVTNETKDTLICHVNSYLAIKGTYSVFEELIWILASGITTVLNLVTAVRIMQKSALQLFDVCLLHYSAIHLLHGNILFISMALFSVHGHECSFVIVVVVAFLMLSFTRLIIFIVIAASQLLKVRAMRTISPPTNQAIKAGKKSLFLILTWLVSAVLVVISLRTGLDLFPIVVIASFGKVTLILRVCIMVLLRRISRQSSGIMIHTLAKVKKSIKLLSWLILIEICAWLPSVVAGLLFKFSCKQTGQLRVANWCLKVLFLTPMFYTFVTGASMVSLKKVLTRSFRRCCRKVEAEAAQCQPEPDNKRCQKTSVEVRHVGTNNLEK